MKIGFAYNLKDCTIQDSEIHAEYETPDTIEAISTALSAYGTVIHLPCEPGIAEKIVLEKPDAVFNIAEGWGDRNRESLIPSLCNLLGIPFSGSDSTSLGITMDKALTKRILRDVGVVTSDFILYDELPSRPPSFGFPVFVKPNCDGSSRGIYKHSYVNNLDQLIAAVERILLGYGQPAIVEPYLSGRDFCVALIGNDPPEFLNTCEVLLGHEDGIPFFSREYKVKDTDRLDMDPGIDKSIVNKMEKMSLISWDVLGLKDFARFDFRTDETNTPYLLEINALPGLSPISGIFVKQAEASGISYNSVIGKIFERVLKKL